MAGLDPATHSSRDHAALRLRCNDPCSQAGGAASVDGNSNIRRIIDYYLGRTKLSERVERDYLSKCVNDRIIKPEWGGAIMANQTSNVTKKQARAVADTKPRFPYTNKPGSLRRFLKEVPNRPKPSKVDQNLMKSWGFGDNNDMTVLRVLKAVDLLSGSSEPTPKYVSFMSIDGGGTALAPEIKRVYAPLFQVSLKPYAESNDKLKNLFNIHSGGGDKVLDLQIQTFKVLCEYASFDMATSASGSVSDSTGTHTQIASTTGAPAPNLGAGININLHIHLPENKTRRDYEDIIEDIGRYIFGRTDGAKRE